MEESETLHMETSSVLLRQLNEAEEEMLRRQDEVTEFKRNKLEAEAQRNWDKFYHRNSANFFKDRHWTRTELEDIRMELQLPNELVFLEAGCGVGNMLFPLAEHFPGWTLCGFDFAKNAIVLLDERATAEEIQVSTAVIDLTKPTEPPAGFAQADVASMIFVLSAIHPSNHQTALANLIKFVRPGGYVIFRDYGLYDHAMLRFGRASKLGERFYARQDGTRAYYFTVEEVSELFRQSGFDAVRCEYLYRRTVNHQKKLNVQRIFVQGIFRCK